MYSTPRALSTDEDELVIARVCFVYGIYAVIRGGLARSETRAPFLAFDGQISGTMLSVVAPRLIVQSWRSTNFRDGDPDSTLILAFAPEGKDGRIDLIHIDVPEQDYQGVGEGWEKYYWAPWKRYLAQK